MTDKTEYTTQFTYVAVRPFSGDALTEKELEKIASLEDKLLLMRFYASGFEEMFESILSGHDKRKPELKDDLLRAFSGGYIKDFDWVYQYGLYTFSEDSLISLRKYKDPYFDGAEAYERCVSHWGTQRWGGLKLEISHEGRTIMDEKVDVFVSSKLKSDKGFILGAYSHIPESAKTTIPTKIIKIKK